MKFFKRRFPLKNTPQNPSPQGVTASEISPPHPASHLEIAPAPPVSRPESTLVSMHEASQSDGRGENRSAGPSNEPQGADNFDTNKYVIPGNKYRVEKPPLEEDLNARTLGNLHGELQGREVSQVGSSDIHGDGIADELGELGSRPQALQISRRNSINTVIERALSMFPPDSLHGGNDPEIPLQDGHPQGHQGVGPFGILGANEFHPDEFHPNSDAVSLLPGALPPNYAQSETNYYVRQLAEQNCFYEARLVRGKLRPEQVREFQAKLVGVEIDVETKNVESPAVEKQTLFWNRSDALVAQGDGLESRAVDPLRSSGSGHRRIMSDVSLSRSSVAGEDASVVFKELTLLLRSEQKQRKADLAGPQSAGSSTERDDPRSLTLFNPSIAQCNKVLSFLPHDRGRKGKSKDTASEQMGVCLDDLAEQLEVPFERANEIVLQSIPPDSHQLDILEFLQSASAARCPSTSPRSLHGGHTPPSR